VVGGAANGPARRTYPHGVSTAPSSPAPQPESGEPAAEAAVPPLGPAVAKYALGRLALVVVVAGVLAAVHVPLWIAVIIGLLVALPLSLVLLRGPRRDMNVAIAAAGQRRRERKERLRAQLRGEVGPDSAQGVQRQADGGAQRPDQHDQPAGAEDGDQLAAPDTAEHPTDR
jgi:hypothetical protein